MKRTNISRCKCTCMWCIQGKEDMCGLDHSCLPKDTPQPTQEWEKGLLDILIKYTKYPMCQKEVVDFIRQLLTSQKQDLASKVEGMKKQIDNERMPFALQDVLKNIGFNQAIDEVLKIINN